MDLDPIFLAVLFVVWAVLRATAFVAAAFVRKPSYSYTFSSARSASAASASTSRPPPSTPSSR